MKYLIQLISAENGARSEPMMVTMDQFKDALRQMDENETTEWDDYALIVGSYDDEQADGMDQLQIVKTPLVNLRTLREKLIGDIAA